MFAIGILILLIALFILISYHQSVQTRIELTFIILVIIAIIFMVHPQQLSKFPIYFIKFYFGP